MNTSTDPIAMAADAALLLSTGRTSMALTVLERLPAAIEAALKDAASEGYLRGQAHVIPASRIGDGRGQPREVGERAQPSGLGEERVPGGASCVDHGLVAAGEHAVAEPAVAQVLPHPLNGLVMVPL